MNVKHIKNFDLIVDLPTDSNPISPSETQILNMIFGEEEEEENKDGCKTISEIILIVFLFVLFSMSDDILLKILPLHTILIFKIVSIIAIYYLIKRFIIG